MKMLNYKISILNYKMPKKVSKKKQKQSITININSNNKKAASNKSPSNKLSSGGHGFSNVPPPQYITPRMPSTINNTPMPVLRGDSSSRYLIHSSVDTQRS